MANGPALLVLPAGPSPCLPARSRCGEGRGCGIRPRPRSWGPLTQRVLPARRPLWAAKGRVCGPPRVGEGCCRAASARRRASASVLLERSGSFREVPEAEPVCAVPGPGAAAAAGRRLAVGLAPSAGVSEASACREERCCFRSGDRGGELGGVARSLSGGSGSRCRPQRRVARGSVRRAGARALFPPSGGGKEMLPGRASDCGGTPSRGRSGP